MSADKRLDAVFEGGGVRGIGLVGAMSAIEADGYEFVNLAGTSAGAIVATLKAAGYTSNEVRQIIDDLDFGKLTDTSAIGRLPYLGPAAEILTHFGVYRGDYLLSLVRDLLAQKGVRTFGDLVLEGYADEPRFRFKVRVVASDLSRGRMLVLPDDVVSYGMQPEALDVALAVRMSISIPFFFRPVRQRNPNGETSYIVDGGLLSNFPVELFDSPGVPEWPTFGFRLSQAGPPPVIANRIRGPISLLAALIYTAMSAHDARYVETHNFARSIMIDALGISATDFRLTGEQKAALYDSGVKAAKDFLSRWDFDAYTRVFRSGSPTPSRRVMVEDALARAKGGRRQPA